MKSQLHLLLFTTTTLLLTIPSSAAATTAYPSSYGDESCHFSVAKELTPERRDTYANGRIIDITHRITPDMPAFTSNDGVGQFIWLVKSQKNGSIANNSEMKLASHTGTHVDAPSHFYDKYLDAGFDVDSLDLDVLNGPALLVDVPRNNNITADVMKSLHIPKGVRRVLFRTLNTDRRLMFKKEFDSSYVGFMEDGAQWVVDNTDIKLVGIDYLSVAAFDDLAPSHLVFLESREIILVEGLKLDDVPAGMYNVHCLHPRLVGAEGSPIRCILIKQLHFLLLIFTITILLLSSTAAAAAAAAYSKESDQQGVETFRDGGRIIDITHRITPSMPDYETFSEGLGEFIWFFETMRNGSLANFSKFKLPTHTGTHVDSPAHFFIHYMDAGFDVDTLDLHVLNGAALLVDVPRDSNITADVMKSLHIPKGVTRVLFRTLNTDRRLMFKEEFDTTYVGFMKDGAKWLVDNTDIKLVGVDYLSAAAYDNLAFSHLVFLESREIILVEGLKLDDIPAGTYNVHCLPLRLLGAEGSPIRCILMK
ncbi:Cyclase-like protein 2 [Bienertia sinuspersici]